MKPIEPLPVGLYALLMEFRQADSQSAVNRATEKIAAFLAAPDHSELVEAATRIVKWLDRLAAAAEERAKDTRFITLSEANAADAKNYRATAADLRAALKKKKED